MEWDMPLFYPGLRIRVVKNFDVLKEGDEGVIISTNCDSGNYILVKFFSQKEMKEVLYSNITPVINDTYVKKYQKFKTNRKLFLEIATDILWIEGKRGSFKSLSFNYINGAGKLSTKTKTSKNEAEELLFYFKLMRKEVKKMTL